MGLISVFLIALLSLWSCNKKQTCSTWVVPPPSSFAFQILEGGNKLSDSALAEIKCYYLKGGSKNNIMLLYSDSVLTEYIANKGILIDNVDMIYAAGNNGIKDFYIEFPSGDIDTIYLDIEKVETCQAKQEKCYCQYPIRNVKFNNKEVSEHELSWVYGAPIYIFDK